MYGFLLSLIVLAQSSKIIEYHFGLNFGQIIKDRSSNDNHGVNGNSYKSTDQDIFFTDRGAYLDGSNNRIYSPNNDYVSKYITISDFNVLMWVLSTSTDGLVLLRRENNKFFIAISRNKSINSLKLQASFNSKSYTYTGPSNSFPSSNF